MKSSILTSAGAAGLIPLQWNAFSVAAGASYAPFAATITPTSVQVIAAEGAGYYPNFKYRFVVAPNIPAWIKPGVGLFISASVTLNGTSYNSEDTYVVKNIDQVSSGYFEVDAPSPNSSRDAVAITQAVAATNVDSGSGAVPSPAVNLVIQAQQALVQVSVGTALIAPIVNNGTAPYAISLTTTSAEYLISAPAGSKFDLADWQVKQSGGAATVNVRFI